MTESKAMKELRETRDRISEEIKDMDTKQIKAYFKKGSESALKKIDQIRKQKPKAM